MSIIDDDKQHYCILCGGKFHKTELNNSKNGYVCKQCSHYRNACRAIFYPIMVILFSIIITALKNSFVAWLWEINYYDFYNSGTALKISIISGIVYIIIFAILFSLTKYCVKAVAIRLSIKKYRKLGITLNIKDTPTTLQDFSSNSIRKAYINGEYKNASEAEDNLIKNYRNASDNIREEVLLVLSLEPTPEKKKQKYKSYSMQEAYIILAYRNASKTIQNTVRQKLNIAYIPEKSPKQNAISQSKAKGKYTITSKEKDLILGYRAQTKETQNSVCKLLSIKYVESKKNSIESDNKFVLSSIEIQIIESYRNNSDMQNAVDTLLGVAAVEQKEKHA